jgi:ATP synthase protein I
MSVSQNNEQLRKQIERQVRRMQKAQRERPTLLSQTAYIGVLGLVFVLPVVGGAYLGRWLDGLVAGYSMRWTLSMIFLGVVVGAVNVYLLVRE